MWLCSGMHLDFYRNLLQPIVIVFFIFSFLYTTQHLLIRLLLTRAADPSVCRFGPKDDDGCLLCCSSQSILPPSCHSVTFPNCIFVTKPCSECTRADSHCLDEQAAFVASFFSHRARRFCLTLHIWPVHIKRSAEKQEWILIAAC